MSIVAQCPHCETRFTLQPDMAGKSMRCPNLECRQVFQVKAMTATAPPAPPPPPPYGPQARGAGPGTDGGAAPPKPKAKPPEPPPAAKKPTKPVRAEAAEGEVVEAKVVDAAVVSGPKVKEVVWSEDADMAPPPPPKKNKKAKAVADDDAPDPDFIPRRKKKSNRRPLILAGMAILILAALGFTGIYVLRQKSLVEDKLAAQAKDEYTKGDYSAAARNFEKLAADYPGSSKIDEYKFFADLAAAQSAVRATGVQDDYASPLKRLNTFIDTYKDSPLAKPAAPGAGRDVLDAGKKLGDEVAAYAAKQVTAYRADRTKSDALTKAEAAVADGRKLADRLDPFRGPDDPPLDKLKGAFDQVVADVKQERDRAAALARAKGQLEDPSDALIQAVEAELRAAKLGDDPEAQAMLADARIKLGTRIRYEDDPADPLPGRAAPAALLFASPVGPPKVPPPEAGPGVFLCVARGVLYALDEGTGKLEWALRVGAEVGAPPPVARVTLAGGPTDVAVVVSDPGARFRLTDQALEAVRAGGAPPAVLAKLKPLGRDPLPRGELAAAVGRLLDPGEAAQFRKVILASAEVTNPPVLAAHVLKTGEQLWSQPLPDATAGPPVLVGARAFVPLRDDDGTVLEFDAATGRRLGRIRLGQTLSDRGAAVRPGTNLLYLTAEARRLFVLDVGAQDGGRVPPRCVQMIKTDHLPGAVKVPPTFIEPRDGGQGAGRWMILAQADGPAVTRLRAIPLAPLAPVEDGAPVPELTPKGEAAQPVPGWVWFPPDCDGERLAVASDTGQFRLFGLNQPGNLDKPLFPSQVPELPATAPDRPVRGLVIRFAESEFWVAAGGSLRRARLAPPGMSGQAVVFSAERPGAGEPLHAAQLGARQTACLATRVPNSSGCRALCFDLNTGAVRWERQLGLVPAAALAQGNTFVLVDEDGAVTTVPAAGGDGPAAVVPAAPGANNPTAVAADDKTAFAVTPLAGGKLLVRRVAGGKPVGDADEVTAPALAGRPAVVGGVLYLPLADGQVHRFVPGAGVTRPAALVAGPAWRGAAAPAGAGCFVTPLGDGAFATSDGTAKLTLWQWPANSTNFKDAGSWDLRAAPVGPGAAVPGGRFVVASAGGTVWLLGADQVGPPVRKWEAGSGALPAGRPGQPAVQSAGGRATVAYLIDGKTLVALDPDKADPLWATPLGDAAAVGPPVPAGADRWLVGDLSGRVRLFDAQGAAADARAVGPPGAVPAAAPAVVGTAALVGLSDGSAVLSEVPK